jgi:tRNA (mo5U34)-methyltransferase
VENVVKPIVRCAFYGWHPEVLVCDVEDEAAMAQLQADVVHHVGVLYHLRDPVRHLLTLGRVARHAVLLDTHVATPAEATASMEVDGHTYPYRRYREGGVDEVFSGMYEHAKWLTLDGLVDVLGQAGFGSVDVVEERAERNGTRVLVVGGRS